MNTVRLLGSKEDLEAKKGFIPGMNIAHGGGVGGAKIHRRGRMWEWKVFAEGQPVHPSCPWHVSQLLCPLVSLDNCCPTGPQKVECTHVV